MYNVQIVQMNVWLKLLSKTSSFTAVDIKKAL